jgi:hypothetical protein
VLTIAGRGSLSAINITAGAFGSGVSGNSIAIGSNTTGNGAASCLITATRTNVGIAWWVDASSVVRIHSAVPTEGGGSTTDVAGIVVGTQTSSLDTKDLLGDDLAPAAALAAVLETPVHRFKYKNGAYCGSEFHGIIADYSPQFAMDPDEAHPFGRSFNPVSAFGYTVQAIKALQAQLAALRSELDELKAA